MSGNIEILARGVCVKAGQLLVCHTEGAGNTYLPGGHVEFLEKAKTALEREIQEEMGLESAAGRFLGAVEHSFGQADGKHSEINLLFELSIAQVSPDHPPESCESHIDFQWLSLAELAGSNLEPFVMREKLSVWLPEAQDDRWASTY